MNVVCVTLRVCIEETAVGVWCTYLPGGGGGGGEQSSEDGAEVLKILCVHGPLQCLLKCTYKHSGSMRLEPYSTSKQGITTSVLLATIHTLLSLAA